MSAPLSVSNSKIKVMNAALAVLGVNPITSFLDNSIAARTGNALFDDTLEAALSGYPWRFARDRVKLTRVNEDAPPPWQTVWQLTSTALAVHSIYEDDQQVLFDRFGTKIVTMTGPTSTAEIWAEITAAVVPDQWAGYFRQAFVLTLASTICLPITQNEQLDAQTAAKAEKAMIFAKSRDAQGRSPSRIDTKMFIRARRARGVR
jgi:hypothetical protein